jgi:hypothetical protein
MNGKATVLTFEWNSLTYIYIISYLNAKYIQVNDIIKQKITPRPICAGSWSKEFGLPFTCPAVKPH